MIGLAGDDLAADGGLDRHVEELARDELAQLLDQLAAAGVGLVAVDDQRQGVDGLAVDQDVELDQLGAARSRRAVVEAGVALGARLELVVEVGEDLGQRQW